LVSSNSAISQRLRLHLLRRRCQRSHTEVVMIQFLYGQDELVSRLVANLQGAEHGRRNCKTIGVLDETGEFLGGAVFYNWNPEAGIIEISASAISPRWLSRRTLKRIGEFVFHECECQLLLVYLRADHERVLTLLAGLGFTFRLVPRLFGRDLDGVLCTLTDDEWFDGRISRGAHTTKEAA